MLNASPVPFAPGAPIRGPLYREVTALASAAAAVQQHHQVVFAATPGGEGGGPGVAYSLEGTAGMLAELNEARVLLETKARKADSGCKACYCVFFSSRDPPHSLL